MSDGRSCFRRDEENKKRQQRKSKSVHIKCFSASEKRTQPLLICLRYESLQQKNVSVSMHSCDIRHRSAPVDKRSLHSAAAGPHPDRTEAQRKVTFPQPCKWIALYNNQGRSCFFCRILIALVPSYQTSSCYFDAAV